jgi:hypothetical protein
MQIEFLEKLDLFSACQQAFRLQRSSYRALMRDFLLESSARYLARAACQAGLERLLCTFFSSHNFVRFARCGCREFSAAPSAIKTA